MPFSREQLLKQKLFLYLFQTVCKDDISSQFSQSNSILLYKVDVIVNTTNDKVDLNANSCGRALLKVAGKELLNECKKIGSLQPGNITSTGPAKLNCRRVYHVRASQWSNGKGALV